MNNSKPHDTIKLPKNLRWLTPYLKDAEKLLPEMQRLVRITCCYPKDDLKSVQGIFAQITKWTDGYYSISMYLGSKKITRLEPVEYKINKLTKIQLLEHLSHELAHLRYLDEHTPSHKILEMKICNKFMKRLIKQGYLSEEYEIKQRGRKTKEQAAQALKE